MKTEIKKSAKLILSRDDLAGILGKHLNQLTDDKLKGYEIIGIREVNKTEWMEGADPHDAFPVEIFDGIELLLELKE